MKIAMNRLKWPLALLVLILSALTVSKGEDEISAYQIPPGAAKILVANMNPSETTYEYFLPNTDFKPTNNNYAFMNKLLKNLVGIEFYKQGRLIKRELYRDKKKHGIQREWYQNGRLKSESPYRNGVLDGTFKQWNEQGQLISQYRLTNGNGVARIFEDTGKLQREETFKNNQNNGIRVQYYTTEKLYSLVWFTGDKKVGYGYSFYTEGNLRSMEHFNDRGELHGPYICYTSRGDTIEKMWFVKDQEVTEAQYAAAAAKDPALPPYYEDTTKYREFVTPEVKALLEKYRTMPRVKIPLEFDAQGNPIPAPKTETTH
jgi:antitoxin component YwqK of YwqJK toxin-antitoxin module